MNSIFVTVILSFVAAPDPDAEYAIEVQAKYAKVNINRFLNIFFIIYYLLVIIIDP